MQMERKKAVDERERERKRARIAEADSAAAAGANTKKGGGGTNASGGGGSSSAGGGGSSSGGGGAGSSVREFVKRQGVDTPAYDGDTVMVWGILEGQPEKVRDVGMHFFNEIFRRYTESALP